MSEDRLAWIGFTISQIRFISEYAIRWEVGVRQAFDMILADAKEEMESEERQEADAEIQRTHPWTE